MWKPFGFFTISGLKTGKSALAKIYNWVQTFLFGFYLPLKLSWWKIAG